MKFVTFKHGNKEVSIGFVKNENVYKIDRYQDMLTLIEQYEQIDELAWRKNEVYPLEEVTLKSPLPLPRSIRDFYAFEQHVKTSRNRRGLQMIPEWYSFPVFYFSNHHGVVGPDEEIEIPSYNSMIDFELEIACVIGKKGKDVTLEEADEMIFGFTIMNDWSARDIQRQEMKVGLGPAKGKDFATSLGPMLVTKDELSPFLKDGKYELEMTATINGRKVSHGNTNTLYYSFQEMIVQASKNVMLYPGEVIGSGTVGTGCLLEVGTDIHPWLQSGDEVILSITGLGELRNRLK